LKLINCGDSRMVVVRGPDEEERTAQTVQTSWPTHINALVRSNHPDLKASMIPTVTWPVVISSVDHKPDHPTERSRIEACGGSVSSEDPPRIDGQIAVSRGLGDFEYKANAAKTIHEQKITCCPDIYCVPELQPGAICIMACDGIWDVMSVSSVASLVRSRLGSDPNADLGEIAAELVSTSLRRQSPDNLTAMIIHLADGSGLAGAPDEMKNYEQLCQLDVDIRPQLLAFLKKSRFPAEPRPCDVCRKWVIQMNQCPCQRVSYCSRRCQKRGWKTHKQQCSLNTPQLGSFEGQSS